MRREINIIWWGEQAIANLDAWFLSILCPPSQAALMGQRAVIDVGGLAAVEWPSVVPQ